VSRRNGDIPVPVQRDSIFNGIYSLFQAFIKLDLLGQSTIEELQPEEFFSRKDAREARALLLLFFFKYVPVDIIQDLTLFATGTTFKTAFSQLLPRFSSNRGKERKQKDKNADYVTIEPGLIDGRVADSSCRRVVSTSVIQPKDKTIQCFYCPYQTNRRNHLNEHIRIVHLRMKTVCDLCGKGRSS
jgi:hypothetical protein